MSANGLEQRIHQLVHDRRPELQRLVDETLEHELALLVQERLVTRNGAEGKARESGEHAAGNGNRAAKVCRVCGEQKPVGEYEPRRGTCRACRRAQVRGRAARQASPAADAEPRGAPIAVDELLRRVRGHGAVPDDLERWLIAERFAVRVDGGLAPTGRGVEVGGGIDVLAGSGGNGRASES